MTPPQLITKSTLVIDHKATGKAMRKYRLACEVSARKVASFMGESYSHYSDMEAGRRQWSAAKVKMFLRGIVWHLGGTKK